MASLKTFTEARDHGRFRSDFGRLVSWSVGRLVGWKVGPKSVDPLCPASALTRSSKIIILFVLKYLPPFCCSYLRRDVSLQTVVLFPSSRKLKNGNILAASVGRKFRCQHNVLNKVSLVSCHYSILIHMYICMYIVYNMR